MRMGVREDILREAEKYIGVPYKGIYSGTGPEDGGFTCSGFTRRSYHDAGIDIPIAQGIKSYYTGSYNGWDTQAGWTISNGHWVFDEDELEPGDLVFYSPVGDRTRTGHVAIYYGDGKVIHANGNPVAITPLDGGGWFVGGGWPLEELPEEYQGTSEVFPMSLTVRFNRDMNVRDAPSTRTGNAVTYYDEGGECTIDSVVISDGYAWGHYVGRSSGKDRYVALGDLEFCEVVG